MKNNITIFSVLSIIIGLGIFGYFKVEYISELKTEITKLKKELNSTQEELDQKDSKLDELRYKAEYLRSEIQSLSSTNYNTDDIDDLDFQASELINDFD